MLHTNPQALSSRAFGLDPRERIANRDTREIGQSSALDAAGKVYSRRGGLLSGEEVSLLMRRHTAQPVSQLARWIVLSNIISLDNQGQTWIPLFQFEQDDMSIKPTVSAVLAELAPLLDGNELAVWFASANDWLAGASPLDTIEVDFPAVLKAARADRFVIRG